MRFMVVTLETSHLEMSQLNDDAKENVAHMFFTLDTSHLEMSPLNDDAAAVRGDSHLSNNFFILITAETFHNPIGPCGPLRQSVGDK